MAATRKYYEWNETNMKLAITALKKKECGLNEASRVYGVPKATLKRRFNGMGSECKRREASLRILYLLISWVGREIVRTHFRNESMSLCRHSK